MYEWVARFETTDFEIEKEWRIEVPGLFEPRGKIVVEPAVENKTKMEVYFQTEQISKPPSIQIAVARVLLSDFLDYIRFSLERDIQITLIEIVPNSRETQKQYNAMKEPPNWTFTNGMTRISSKNFSAFAEEFRQIYAPRFGTVQEHEKWKVYYMMQRSLHWFTKSLEATQTVDRLMGIWISFNILYSYVWQCQNSKNAKDWEKIENFSIKSRVLSLGQCQKIVEDSSNLVLMQDSAYAKDFAQHKANKEWYKALNCVLQTIRELRNNIFHGSWVPEKSYEHIHFSMKNQPLEISVGLLRKVLRESYKNLLGVS